MKDPQQNLYFLTVHLSLLYPPWVSESDCPLWKILLLRIKLPGNIFLYFSYIRNYQFIAGKSVGGFFSGLSSYVEENKEWVKSVAADATAAIKENVKVRYDGRLFWNLQ